ncbi:hypothetical protein KP509_32G037600 [Ceratopteris richardii]|uniref:Dirigent protein n=1 Tax=Ceratopteris richardii TaxID=49495 RepID=A0A8T2QSW0_CERRI|nr:hypothetical protein KP509_1Z184400 [Ceratopteris richardii]KAH6556372.1 hypothetical protein KP509_1Z184500 [Ceratopteris richardii]KAH7287089.1 hypothetical protein KP509_32G037600 [Ceratopteris richardii]
MSLVLFPRFLLKLMLLAAFTACATTGTHAKKRLNLHFYMLIVVQNNTCLNNPKAKYTAVQTGEAPVPQPFSFGVLHTFDNPLSRKMSLEDPADHVGRVQGWYGDCGQTELTLCIAQTFAYDDGASKGTFALLGSDIATDRVKYAPIVGGTGDFTFCRGIASQMRVFHASIDSEETAWFEYNITLKF